MDQLYSYRCLSWSYTSDVYHDFLFSDVDQWVGSLVFLDNSGAKSRQARQTNQRRHKALQ